MRNVTEVVAKVVVTITLLVAVVVPDPAPEERPLVVAAVLGYWLREGERQTLRHRHDESAAGTPRAR